MFDDGKLYPTDDPALLALGRPQTLRHWRVYGIGPRYVKIGKRIYYCGSALNEYIAQSTVHTLATKPRRKVATQRQT